MFIKNFILIMFLAFSATAFAEKIVLNPNIPEKYTVQKGDTLWDISAHFLSDPWLWPLVFKGNQHIDNPHLIYPGDVVTLRFDGGQPVLEVTSNEQVDQVNRDVKLSPHIRVQKRDHAKKKLINLADIQQFLVSARVVGDKEIDNYPYVVSSYNQSLGNKLYVRGLDENVTEIRYSLYRKRDAYTNPRKDPDKILGYEALYIGDVVLDTPGDPASFIITSAQREIFNGDRLIPKSREETVARFLPAMPKHDVNANILSVIDGVAQIGQYNTVVIDVGNKDGIEVGHILAVYQDGELVKDDIATESKREREARIVIEHEDKSFFNKELSAIINGLKTLKTDFNESDLVEYLTRPNNKSEIVKLPNEYTGLLMISRVFENVSYGIVMKVNKPIHVLDSVRSL